MQSCHRHDHETTLLSALPAHRDSRPLFFNKTENRAVLSMLTDMGGEFLRRLHPPTASHAHEHVSPPALPVLEIIALLIIG